MSDVLIILFALVTVVPVLFILWTKDIIRAAFALVITLLGLSAIYVLLFSELMAVVQILMYAGGIVVLLLFGIMLTKRVENGPVTTRHRNRFLGIASGLMFMLVLFSWIAKAEFSYVIPERMGDTVENIGVLFLTDHLIAFELIAFILLVALVGASYLAKRSNS